MKKGRCEEEREREKRREEQFKHMHKVVMLFPLLYNTYTHRNQNQKVTHIVV